MKIKQIIKKYYKDAIILFLGNLLLAIGVSFCFINYQGYHFYGNDPENLQSIYFNGILVGGTSGFSLIIRNIIPSLSGHVETIITLLTVALFLIGAIFLGKKFALQTLVSTILYPIFLYFLKIDWFNSIRVSMNQFDPIVCGIIGGILMGVGCGVIYRIGGSTGGFDIPGLIINKYTHIKLSKIFIIMDGMLVVLALIAKFSLYEVVVGLIAVIAYSISVELAQLRGTRCYICEIISDKWQEINKDILALDRGSTIIDVRGGFTDKPRKMIKAMVGKNQYNVILNIVKKHDPNAFMSMQQTNDIFGEGYKNLSEYSNK